MATSDTDENRAVHGKAPATNGRNDAVPAILNGLLGATWRAYAQHQTHVALIEAWGLKGLADQMRVRTADEPVTINAF